MMRRLLRKVLLAAVLTTSAGSVSSALAQQMVVIPIRVIYPGEVVTGDSLEQVPLRRQVKNLGALALNPTQLEGKVARRTLLPGRMIPVSSVREAWLVETGKPVQVRFIQGGLEIQIMGISLQTGSAGDTVRIRNADSGTVFNGVVMADGTIKVSS
jgi:flagella basal body P-ring formation protein FlgA